MQWEARVYITLKPGVLDPQGKAVQHALAALDYRGVQDVRVGKFIVLQVEAETQAQATAAVEEMCQRLLANPVIEQYRVEVLRGEERGGASR